MGFEKPGQINNEPESLDRRKFLRQAVALVGAGVLSSAPDMSEAAEKSELDKEFDKQLEALIATPEQKQRIWNEYYNVGLIGIEKQQMVRYISGNENAPKVLKELSGEAGSLSMHLKSSFETEGYKNK